MCFAALLALARAFSVSDTLNELALLERDWLLALASPGLIDRLALACLALAAVTALGSRPRAALMGLMAAAMIFAGAAWDRRDQVQRNVEHGAAPPGLLAAIPEDASVFYEGKSKEVWLYLGRRAYVAGLHGAPAVFWRPLALEFKRRADTVAPMQTPYLATFGVPLSQFQIDYPPIDANAVRETCASAHDLDFILSHRRVEGLYTSAWPIWGAQNLAPAAPVSPNMIFLYDCGALR